MLAVHHVKEGLIGLGPAVGVVVVVRGAVLSGLAETGDTEGAIEIDGEEVGLENTEIGERLGDGVLEAAPEEVAAAVAEGLVAAEVIGLVAGAEGWSAGVEGNVSGAAVETGVICIGAEGVTTGLGCGVGANGMLFDGDVTWGDCADGEGAGVPLAAAAWVAGRRKKYHAANPIPPMMMRSSPFMRTIQKDHADRKDRNARKGQEPLSASRPTTAWVGFDQFRGI